MWNVPDENLQFGMGLVIFAVSLGLIVAATYTVVLPSFMAGVHEGIRTPRTVLVAVIVGGIDMTGGLMAIVLSGGWGSPFWHAWLASLIIPCIIFRRTLVPGAGRRLHSGPHDRPQCDRRGRWR